MSPLITAVVIKRPKQNIFKDFFISSKRVCRTCVRYTVYPLLKKQSIAILTACESGARVSHRNNSILRVYLTNWQRKKVEWTKWRLYSKMKSIIGKQTDHVHTFRRDSRDFRLKKMKVIVKEKKLWLNKPCWKSCFTSHRKKCYHLGRYVSYEKTGATSHIDYMI